MNKPSKQTESPKQKTTPNALPTDTINSNFTAKPDHTGSSGQVMNDSTLDSTSMEYGEMNLKDAKESGYTDASGKAVDMAKKDVEGSPTGAFTDIGAGRSSAIHKNSSKHH